MVNYKITNITNTFGKRDMNYMEDVNIEYVNGMKKEKITLKPDKSIIISTDKLPLSVHRLRLKNMIIVKMVDDTKENKSNVSKSKVNKTQPKKKNVDDKPKGKGYNKKPKTKAKTKSSSTKTTYKNKSSATSKPIDTSEFNLDE